MNESSDFYCARLSAAATDSSGLISVTEQGAMYDMIS